MIECNQRVAFHMISLITTESTRHTARMTANSRAGDSDWFTKYRPEDEQLRLKEKDIITRILSSSYIKAAYASL